MAKWVVWPLSGGHRAADDVDMKHTNKRHVEVLDPAITLEEWRRANSRPEAKSVQIVRPHETDAFLIA